jgi:hypothetical protein
MKRTKNNPIYYTLKSPCNRCAKGPYVLRDKNYSCCDVGPVRAVCHDWVESTVLIVFDEEPC